MSLCYYYKGRLTFNELIEMPIDRIKTLQYLAYIHRNDHKDLKEAEAMEDLIEGNI